MNPYELRLNLLKLAYQVLENNLNNHLQRESNYWQAMMNHAMDNQHLLPEYPEVKTISIEQVIQEADKLNAFISEKQ